MINVPYERNLLVSFKPFNIIIYEVAGQYESINFSIFVH